MKNSHKKKKNKSKTKHMIAYVISVPFIEYEKLLIIFNSLSLRNDMLSFR